jgi:zinc protease
MPKQAPPRSNASRSAAAQPRGPSRPLRTGALPAKSGKAGKAAKLAKQARTARSAKATKADPTGPQGPSSSPQRLSGSPQVRAGRSKAAAAAAAPMPASRLRLDLPIERYELSCGAILLVSPRPGAPITAAQVHMRGGLALDPAGLEGTAFLAGALASEGTEQHTEEQLADLLEPEGGSLSGDSSGLSGSIVSGSWELLLDLLGELLLAPTYPEDKVERQRARLLQRLEVERRDHRTQAGQLFRRLVYGSHWLGRSERGTVESVGAIRRAHIHAHQRDHWVAARAVIAVCGDVQGESVRRFLERRLRGWRRGEPIELPGPDFPPLESRTAGFQADRQQVQVCLGHLGIKRSDPDYVAALVMDHILGTGPGFTDRISKRLRDQEGLAYSVQANLHGTAGVQPGMFLATIGTSPDKLSQALTGFIEEIARIRADLVLPEELDLARQYLTGSFVLGFERAARRAHYMVQAHRYGLPADDLATLPARIAAVSAEQIQSVAQRHLHPEALSLTVGGPIDPRRLPDLLRDAQQAALTPRRAPRRRSKA